MRKNARVPGWLLGIFLVSSCQTPPTAPTPRSSTVTTYHGVTVTDPYDWLEDMKSAPTQAWIDQQNTQTFAFLDKIPQRLPIRDRLAELWDYEKIGTPWREGSRYFQYRNNGLQNHHVLYVMESLEDPGRALIDPNTFSEDGTVSLSGVSISNDGEWAAYSISQSGSDWREINIRNINSGQDLEESIKWVKFSRPSWSRDNKGFYYGRYDAVDLADKHKQVLNRQRLYYHRIGTAQDEDQLVYENPAAPKWGYGATETEDGKYLLLSVWKDSGSHNALFFRPLDRPTATFKPLFDQFDANYSFIDNQGETLWLHTNHDAPRGKVVKVDILQPAAAHWQTIIPEQPHTLRNVNLIADKFICTYMKDAKSLVRIYNIEGEQEQDLPLPGIGSARGFQGKRTHQETFFSYSSFNTPSQIFRYDVQRATTTLLAQPTVKFNSSQYTTKQVFFTSKDGTSIPMFVSHKKDLATENPHPTLLYGYGGFNASLTPRFSVSRLVWMEMGGIYAVANIRGGGEYGKAWHEAGTKQNKQNVFDDFIAAAEHLITEGYTTTEKLAIAGGSNGGLLVGACLTQRPDLFGAALPSVGVMDMLKYHTFTIGWAWASDYGTVEDPAEFQALYAYSPYHNCHPTTYPPTLVTTADTDDRVVPAHSYKFTAALQYAQEGDSPILIRVDRKAGHGGGKPTTMIIEEHADRMAFLYKALGMSGSK